MRLWVGDVSLCAFIGNTLVSRERRCGGDDDELVLLVVKGRECV